MNKEATIVYTLYLSEQSIQYLLFTLEICSDALSSTTAKILWVNQQKALDFRTMCSMFVFQASFATPKIKLMHDFLLIGIVNFQTTNQSVRFLFKQNCRNEVYMTKFHIINSWGEPKWRQRRSEKNEENWKNEEKGTWSKWKLTEIWVCDFSFHYRIRAINCVMLKYFIWYDI